MPLETHTRSRAPFAPQLDLPPPFALITLREVGDAFAHAIETAPARGAGTLTYVGRFDLAEFAVVLEP
jgi:biotin/lipoate A/B protein ligase family protein